MMFFPTSQSWENLLMKLSEPGCSVRSLLRESEVVIAIRYQVQEICQYFFDNLEEVFDIAIGTDEDSNNARGVIFLLPEQFPLEISESSAFHNKMNSILKDENMKPNAPVTLSRVILALGKSENYTILSNLAENHFFFPKFCKLIGNASVYETLFYLATDSHRAVSSFFEDMNATLELFRLIPEANQIEQERIFIVMTELIISTDSESTMIASLSDDEHMEEILKYCIENQSPKIRAAALRLLENLCCKEGNVYSKSYSEDEEEGINNSFVEFTLSKIDSIYNFVINSQQFDLSVFQAVEFLTLLIKFGKLQVTDLTFNCMNSLLDRFFSNMHLTKLHGSSLCLLNNICVTLDDINKLNLKERILKFEKEIKSNRNVEICCNGFIYKIIDIISDLEKKSDQQQNNEEWNNLINNDYNHYMDAIKAEYGGKVPNINSYDSSYSENRNGLDDLIRRYDEEDEIKNSSSNSDDANEIKKIPPPPWSDDGDVDQFFGNEVQLTEIDMLDDIISKPSDSPGTSWAKEIVDELEFDEEFIIPKKEAADNQIKWANKALQELQDEENNVDNDDIFEIEE